MGFDIVVSTLHKNYPGNQKAVVFTLEESPYWEIIERGLRTYISNTHSKDIFDIVLATPSIDELTTYSDTVLRNASALDNELKKLHIPVVDRPNDSPYNQHIWIQAGSQSRAYAFFRDLEALWIFTNYRFLPYNLGYGLRLGTAAATRQGMKPSDASEIAEVFGEVWHEGKVTQHAKLYAKDVISRIHKRGAGV